VKHRGETTMKEPNRLDKIQKAAETIQDTAETIQEMISDQTEQIGRFHDEVTGVEGGPGGRFAQYSLADIGNMLAALHGIFEPQLKAKAFEAFDRMSESLKARRIGSDPQAAELADEIIRTSAIGLLPGMAARFHQEWKTQQSNRE
jgi:hypothetical protein